LLELREAHQFGNVGSSDSTVAANDIVMVHDESQPRGLWRLAKVENLAVGRDGRLEGPPGIKGWRYNYFTMAPLLAVPLGSQKFRGDSP